MYRGPVYPRLFVGTFSSHGFFLTPGKRLLCFGSNGSFQLGLGHSEHSLTPTLHPFDAKLIRSSFVKISCGLDHSMLLTNENVYACGESRFGATSSKHKSLQFFTKVAHFTSTQREKMISDLFCGCYNSFFITRGGQVYALGRGDSGELGIGSKDHVVDEPILVNIHPLEKGDFIVSIAPGLWHTIFLSRNGVVFACGEGHTRTGLTTDTTVPLKVNLSGRAKMIGVGEGYSCFLLTDGRLFSTQYSTLRESDDETYLEMIANNVHDISTGEFHCIARVGNVNRGKIKTKLFGGSFSSSDNYLGRSLLSSSESEGYDSYRYSFGLVENVDQSKIRAFAASADNSYFIMNDFSIRGCGDNLTGALMKDYNDVIDPKYGKVVSECLEKKFVESMKREWSLLNGVNERFGYLMKFRRIMTIIVLFV